MGGFHTGEGGARGPEEGPVGAQGGQHDLHPAHEGQLQGESLSVANTGAFQDMQVSCMHIMCTGACLVC